MPRRRVYHSQNNRLVKVQLEVQVNPVKVTATLSALPVSAGLRELRSTVTTGWDVSNKLVNPGIGRSPESKKVTLNDASRSGEDVRSVAKLFNWLFISTASRLLLTGGARWAQAHQLPLIPSCQRLRTLVWVLDIDRTKAGNSTRQETASFGPRDRIERPNVSSIAIGPPAVWFLASESVSPVIPVARVRGRGEPVGGKVGASGIRRHVQTADARSAR